MHLRLSYVSHIKMCERCDRCLSYRSLDYVGAVGLWQRGAGVSLFVLANFQHINTQQKKTKKTVGNSGMKSMRNNV